MSAHVGKQGWGPGRGSPEPWQSAAFPLAVSVSVMLLEVQLVNQSGKNWTARSGDSILGLRDTHLQRESTPHHGVGSARLVLSSPSSAILKAQAHCLSASRVPVCGPEQGHELEDKCQDKVGQNLGCLPTTC